MSDGLGGTRGPQLFKVNKIFHFRFQRDGIRTQRTTRTTSLREAERIAWAAYSGERELPTLRELVRMWLDVHEDVASAGHVRSVEVFARQHQYHLAEMRIDRIRTEDVEEARRLHLQEHAPASVNLWLRILRLLFGWAIRREMLSSLPYKVPMQRLQKRPRTILPIAKANEFLVAVDKFAGPRWGLRTAVRLMLGLGLRESESLGSRWEWISWERGTYTVGRSKGKEAVPLPLRGWLREHLEKRRVPSGLIVVSPSGRRYAAGATQALVARAAREIGISGLSPHRLRGTFASQLSEAGMAVPDIQDLMRHKDSRTTLGYIEKNLDRAAGAIDRIFNQMGIGRKTGEEGVTDARP